MESRLIDLIKCSAYDLESVLRSVFTNIIVTYTNMHTVDVILISYTPSHTKFYQVVSPGATVETFLDYKVEKCEYFKIPNESRKNQNVLTIAKKYCEKENLEERKILQSIVEEQQRIADIQKNLNREFLN